MFNWILEEPSTPLMVMRYHPTSLLRTWSHPSQIQAVPSRATWITPANQKNHHRQEESAPFAASTTINHTSMCRIRQWCLESSGRSRPGEEIFSISNRILDLISTGRSGSWPQSYSCWVSWETSQRTSTTFISPIFTSEWNSSDMVPSLFIHSDWVSLCSLVSFSGSLRLTWHPSKYAHTINVDALPVRIFLKLLHTDSRIMRPTSILPPMDPHDLRHPQFLCIPDTEPERSNGKFTTPKEVSFVWIACSLSDCTVPHIQAGFLQKCVRKQGGLMFV